MNFNQYTIKAQEVVQRAVQIAQSNQQQVVETGHVLKAILEEAGMGFGNVVKSTIFLKSMDDFAVMNEIYASYFEGGNYPARETVEVSCLPKNVSVEISMIAHQF